ncbi:NERD domain-containing protein [Litchfieldia salsa]|uniref:Topoisomerase DNA binding C4 zinc finger n=1 Tax=Litchfieldia salsa TaxID=930152 RepID=A0A1H0PLD5_9BACI|nr:NERD domain-containing protein [Litchfieldia salsa]SDP05438.1 Topoisomerase DNA binding C4 zinc finger [Litchfieldia salsa]
MELIILLLIALAILSRFPSVKGFIGEKSVSLILSKLDKGVYKTKNDFMLHTKGSKTSQIDHVIVSVYGIFVIETKNYKGWIFGCERNKYWTQTIFNKKSQFYNPIHQNYGHIKAIQGFLDNDDDSIFHSIIAFSPRATLKEMNVQSERVKVVYTQDLLKTIHGFNKPILTQQQVQRIVTRLSFVHKPDMNKRKEHVTKIKSTLRVEQQKITSNTCPKCGGVLVQRSGKYGGFTGCSNYPNCRFILKKQA